MCLLAVMVSLCYGQKIAALLFCLGRGFVFFVFFVLGGWGFCVAYHLVTSDGFNFSAGTSFWWISFSILGMKWVGLRVVCFLQVPSYDARRRSSFRNK
jgi:hypothetical protein